MRKHQALRDKAAFHFNALRHYYMADSKEAYDEAMRLGQHQRIHVAVLILRTYNEMNMRQHWRLTRIYRNALELHIRDKDPEPRHTLEMNFYTAALNYYDAKKPGLKAQLMMEKLCRRP